MKFEFHSRPKIHTSIHVQQTHILHTRVRPKFHIFGFFFLNIKRLFGYLKNHTSVHIKQTQILHKKITQHQSLETYLHLLHLANILVILDNMEMVYLIIQFFFFLNDYSVILINVMISLFHVRFLKLYYIKFLKNWYNLCILYVIVCYVIYISLLNLNLN